MYNIQKVELSELTVKDNFINGGVEHTLYKIKNVKGDYVRLGSIRRLYACDEKGNPISISKFEINE